MVLQGWSFNNMEKITGRYCPTKLSIQVSDVNLNISMNVSPITHPYSSCINKFYASSPSLSSMKSVEFRLRCHIP